MLLMESCRETEVGQLNMTVFVNQDIVGLYVTVIYNFEQTQFDVQWGVAYR